jgi:mannose-6-phosphate isomerase
MLRGSNYDRHPVVRVPGFPGLACRGTDEVVDRLRAAVARHDGDCLLAVDCYPGVDEQRIWVDLLAPLAPDRVVRTEMARLSPADLRNLYRHHFTDDTEFGLHCHLDLETGFDTTRLAAFSNSLSQSSGGLSVVLGHGATLFGEPDILVYADLPRWEIGRRFHEEGLGNWGLENGGEEVPLRERHGRFVEWPIADRTKRGLIRRIDFLLDTTRKKDPRLVSGDAFRAGLAAAARRPFRFVPLFESTPWGGQWLKEVCAPKSALENLGRCFDCVPEENSIRLGYDDVTIEVPALDLVMAAPRALLGEVVYARFGEQFPIRFDLLDTFLGGNQSIHVHPNAAYAFDRFGVPAGQDESLYLLDADEGAEVIIGLLSDVNPEEMAGALAAARDTVESPFDADRFIGRWRAKPHDHVLIPAGTVHGLGAGALALTIASAPSVFCFRLWDWRRLGHYGRQRPVHLEHGLANLRWNRDVHFAERELVNRVQPIASGEGWREERTGLHRLQFIETRRHHFTMPVFHDTEGAVNVLNLVKGPAAVVESPTDAFDPFEVHFAETFVVPAAVGPYVVRPIEPGPASELATVKAFVR